MHEAGPFRPARFGVSQGMAIGLSLAGAALLAAVGHRYRIDQVHCGVWPRAWHNALAAGLYLLAIALLSLGWLRLLRLCQTPQGPTTRRIVLWGSLLYGIAACGLPALSEDPLFYAAISRVLGQYHASPYQPFCQTLPVDDSLLQRMIPHWRCGSSPYQAGFHAVAWLLSMLSHGQLVWLLRGFQIVSAMALLLTGLLTAAALRGSSIRPAYAAALVIFNPLSVVEGPASAHNDALLALALSAALLAWLHRRWGFTLLGLLVGLSIKVSFVLVAALAGGAALLSWLRQMGALLHNRRANRALFATLAVLLSGSTAAWLYVARPVALFGSSSLPWEYCTRSIECLPRTLLRTVLHQRQAAFGVAVGFRVLAALWLLFATARASESPQKRLPWLGTGLLIYYLFLHPWSQSWYLLSLLPLLPWSTPRVFAALRAVSISASAYYALVLIGNCLEDELAIAGFDLAEALLVLVPPTVCLLRATPAQPTDAVEGGPRPPLVKDARV